MEPESRTDDRWDAGLSAAIHRRRPQREGIVERRTTSGARLAAVDSLYDRIVIEPAPDEPTPDAFVEERQEPSRAVEVRQDSIELELIAAIVGSVLVLAGLEAWRRRRA